MNRAFFSLVKTLLNVQYGISAFRERYIKDKSRLWQPIVLGLLLLVGFGTLFVMYVFMLTGVAAGGAAVGQPELVLTMTILLAQVIELITGVFTIMTAFYFAQDLSILIPMPLKPSQIVAAKFIGVMLSEYLLTIPLMAPAIIIYANYAALGAMYWIIAVIITLLAPILPLTIASLIVMVLMRLVSATKSKEFFTVLGAVLGVAVSIGMQFFSRHMTILGRDGLDNFAIGNMDFVRMIGSAFPPALWATRAMMMDAAAALYFILFVGVSAALFAGMLLLAQAVFYRSVLAGTEASGRRRALNQQQLAGVLSKKRSHTRALFNKEWKLFWRTPMFVTNTIMPLIVMPVVLIFSMMTMTSSPGQGSQELAVSFASQQGSMIFNLIIVAIFIAASGNAVGYTAFSREGHTFWISAAAPVDVKECINAKLLSAWVIMAPFVVAVIAILSVFMHCSLVDFIIITLMAIPGITLAIFLAMLMDALNPKFDWDTPQMLFKNNAASGFTLLAILLLLAVLVLIAILLIASPLGDGMVYAILMAVMIGLTIPGYFLLLDAARRLYRGTRLS